MQEPLPAYSENHHKLARALAPLAGSEQSYSRADLVRQVRRMFPELSKNDVKPQKHCLNYSISSACACSRSADALFEKLETPDGSHRYRVLSTVKTGSLSRKAESPRLQPAASAFARAPVTPRREAPGQIAAAPAPATPAGLDLGSLLPRLKQWLFGEKSTSSQPQKSLRAASSLSVSKMSLPPLPPLPPLPVVTAPLPTPLQDELPQAPVAAVPQPAEAPVSAPKPVPVEPEAETPATAVPAPTAPAAPLLQVLRLPAPDRVMRLMIQPLSLEPEQKLHLKLSPEAAEASLELVHLHFRDSVVKELAVVGSEPLEVGFRLLGQPGLSRIQIHGLCDGAWQLLLTSEQSFPVLPEPMLAMPAEAPPASEQPQASAPAAEPVAVDASPAQTVEAPEPVAEIPLPEVLPEAPPAPEPPADPHAWLEALPELYRPLMQHIQAHGSLGEAAMIAMLGGGNAGARKARALAVQVDQWQMPFEIEIVQTPEGKTYQKV